jgi:bis(5'-nucleosyl)-tetraphosphatase (symmetrical)
MATYAIGDIQGCFATLQALLAELGFAPSRDQLWLVGDLVNRGRQSLETLRWVQQNEHAVTAVLGNHDLHLLARAAGVSPAKKNDTLDEILAAPDAAALLDWLRHRPLLHHTDDMAMVHAGLHPHWTIAAARSYAAEIEAMLQAPSWRQEIAGLVGTSPRWSTALEGAKRLRAITSYLTRVRTCFADGSINADFDGPLDETPRGCTAWFDFPSPAWSTHRLVTGHWAALGLHESACATAIDTGCVWGNQLTALCLETRAIVSVPAQ